MTVHGGDAGLADDDDRRRRQRLGRPGGDRERLAADRGRDRRARAGTRRRARRRTGVGPLRAVRRRDDDPVGPGLRVARRRATLPFHDQRDVGLLRRSSANAVRTTAPAASTTRIVTFARDRRRYVTAALRGEPVPVLGVEQRRRALEAGEGRVDVDVDRGGRAGVADGVARGEA